MRILVLNYEFPPLGGGAAPVSYDLAKEYVRKGHQVDVITMGFKDLKKREVQDGITIYRVPCIRRKKEVCTFLELLSFLPGATLQALLLQKKNKYDVCHSHFIIPTSIVAYHLNLFLKVPYVVTLHGSDVPGYNEDRLTFLHMFTRPFVRLIAKKAKHVVSPSKYLAGFFAKISKVKPIIIPNGISRDGFKPGKKENIILAAGRFQPLKGFNHLISSVSEKKNWELHIAGDGPMNMELRELAKQSKTKIVFHGWSSKRKMKLLYAKAKIFVLPSQRENSSIALLEAMASGCSVIATKGTGSPELIKDGGELVPFADEKKLLAAIEKVKKNTASYMKKSIKRSKDLDISAISDAYLEILR